MSKAPEDLQNNVSIQNQIISFEEFMIKLNKSVCTNGTRTLKLPMAVSYNEDSFKNISIEGSFKCKRQIKGIGNAPQNSDHQLKSNLN